MVATRLAGEGRKDAHLEHLDVGPCGEDGAVDAENAEKEVVRRDAIEPLDPSLPRSGRSPAQVSAGAPHSASMRCAEKVGCMEFPD
jgi:hypothetical protein